MSNPPTQSPPRNYLDRSAGLCGIFIYAGYSKPFFPTTPFGPVLPEIFHFHNLANFALQVEAFKLLPPWESIRRAHSAICGDCPRAPRTNRLAPAHMGLIAHCDHAGILCGSDARLSPAHGHKLRLFRHPRTHRPKKIVEDQRSPPGATDD